MPSRARICPYRPKRTLSSHHCVAALRTKRAARRNPGTCKASFRFAADFASARNRQEAIQAFGTTTRPSLASRQSPCSQVTLLQDSLSFVVGRLRGQYLCLLYTSDAADDLLCVALGGRRII